MRKDQLSWMGGGLGGLRSQPPKERSSWVEGGGGALRPPAQVPLHPRHRPALRSRNSPTYSKSLRLKYYLRSSLNGIPNDCNKKNDSSSFLDVVTIEMSIPLDLSILS